MTATATKTITLKIDGREVSVDAGSTILDAAKKLGIEIPTLCHNSSLAPYGSCWICAVKVEGARSMVPSCSTKAAEGMKVITSDDEVMQTRKLCLELLLSDHYGDCLGPCQMTCPAGIDVQAYIAHIARGEYVEALRVIKKKNPLPLICGRVCPRPCEDQCRRNLVDEPVAVDALKRFVADIDRAKGEEHYIPPKAEDTGKSVAVVGGGPAGLTCAYFLAQRGHKVKIFESLPSLGGMLRWGIPAYRLPRDVLDDEINTILELGVEVECSKKLGTDYTVESLQKDYDAVFIGIGAVASRSMRVVGEDKEGVMSGTNFLRDFGLGKTFDFKNKKVAVIGGGNTAIDAARTSLRFGADEVTIIYRRSRAEMPAEDIEVKDAEEEGVKFHFLAAPTKVAGDSKVEGIEFVRMELGEPDDSGRRRPVPVEGSETTLPLDIVISAIGQIPDLDCVKDTGFEETSWGSIAANEKSLVTNIGGVFAGGDCVNGAATVVEAVAHGREGAVSIDSYLNGRPIERREKIFNIAKSDHWESLDQADFEHFLKTPRQHMSCMDIAERIAGFSEVEKGLTQNQAKTEAERCLSCGCSDAHTCNVRKFTTDYDIDTKRFGGDKRKEDPDEKHPLIRMEMQKCIMCGACVRTCDEVHNVRAIGFTGRGFSARVRPAFGESLLAAGCISCGACIDVCPTGAIAENLQQAGGPFILNPQQSVCTGCSVGCLLENNFNEAGTLISVQPQSKDIPDAPNRGQFCIRGHFGHLAVDKDKLITKPLVRTDGKLVEVSLAEAVGKAGNLLADNQAVLVSGHTTVEEMKLAKGISNALGAECTSLDKFSEKDALNGIAEITGNKTSPAASADILASDCIFVIEADPESTHHIAGIQTLAAKRLGAKVIRLAASKNLINRPADLRMQANEGQLPKVVSCLISNIIKSAGAKFFAKKNLEKIKQNFSSVKVRDIEAASGITESELEKCAELLLNSQNPLLIIDARIAGKTLAQLSAILAGLLPGNTETLPITALRGAANSHGLSLLAINGIAKSELSGKSVLSIREDLCAAGADDFKSLVVADFIMSESAEKADVVIPLPSLFALQGTMYATGGLKAQLNGMKNSAAENNLQTLAEKLQAEAAELKPAEINTSINIPQDPYAEEKSKQPAARVDSFTRMFVKWAQDKELVF